jgi:hypothetical protein
MRVQLDALEQQIEDGVKDMYFMVGRALRSIRDGRPCRIRYPNIGSFGEYCKRRWEISIRHAERLIAADSFAEKATHGSLKVPLRERHARLLLERLASDEDRLAVWRIVLVDTRLESVRAHHVERAIAYFVQASSGAGESSAAAPVAPIQTASEPVSRPERPENEKAPRALEAPQDQPQPAGTAAPSKRYVRPALQNRDH